MPLSYCLKRILRRDNRHFLYYAQLSYDDDVDEKFNRNSGDVLFAHAIIIANHRLLAGTAVYRVLSGAHNNL